jgi:D-alanine-D-alanine ligase
MSKMRVAVLRGGLSDEYDVSLNSGASVLEHIDKDKFDPLDVIISRGGEWLLEGRTRLPEQVLQTVDAVFIALHGTYGEDGTLQRLLDRYSVPYTGSKAFASALAMNKVLTKAHLKDSHVKVPRHVVVSQGSLKDLGKVVENISSLFGPYYVVKPVASGSSVGTRMVSDQATLTKTLTELLKDFDEVMVEERIDGREASCGVIERYRDKDIYTLPPIEIVVPDSAEFFDNTVKYDGTTEEICPSTFSHDTKREIEELSSYIHKSLDLAQYSRSDFIVSKDGIYFLEVNTLPGLTTESLLPKEICAVGGTYTDFITHLLTDTQALR